VLALGNRLLKDDGVGGELLSLLEPFAGQWGRRVELLDGGTCGLALVGEVQDRSAVVFLDAVKLGAEPGSVHVLRKGDLLGMGSRSSVRKGGSTAHEGGAKEILAALELLGCTPEEITVVGVEPGLVETGIGLSEKVEARLEAAAVRARKEISALVENNPGIAAGAFGAGSYDYSGSESPASNGGVI
jgi:hydrogenase maturation protease